VKRSFEYFFKEKGNKFISLVNACEVIVKSSGEYVFSVAENAHRICVLQSVLFVRFLTERPALIIPVLIIPEIFDA